MQKKTHEYHVSIMIVVRVKEGLGNQMLQYAVGRHLSVKNKSPLWLDLSWYKKQQPDLYPRPFKLNCFMTMYQEVDLDKIIWRLRFTDRFRSLNPFKLANIKEKDYAQFDNEVLESGDNILLEGYFPSYKYFNTIRHLLLDDFTPVETMDDENTTCLQKIRGTNSVSIHIRRGDYSLTNFHSLLDTTYYENAIELVSKQEKNLHLFIFSDDPNWVKQHMNFDYPFELVSFNNDERNYLDMELMKNCKHNIIANSSFSWWSAWLNENKGRMVVAPQKWFNEGAAKGDNIPDDWMLL